MAQLNSVLTFILLVQANSIEATTTRRPWFNSESSSPTPKPAKIWPAGTITVNKGSSVTRVIPRPRLKDENQTNHGVPWSDDSSSTGHYYRCPESLVEERERELNRSLEFALREQLFSHQSLIESFDFECYNEPETPVWAIVLGVLVFVIGVIAFLISRLKFWWNKYKTFIGVVSNKTGDISDVIPELKMDQFTEDGTKDSEQVPKDKVVTRKSQFQSWF